MRRVFFLGAGATKAVARTAPLNNDILRTALGHRNSDVQEDVISISGFIHNTFHRYKTLPRIEDILSLIDFNIKAMKNLGAYDHSSLQEIRSSFVRVIADVLKGGLKDLDNRVTNEFVSKLKNEDTVISTNYDIIVDNALAERGCVNYGVRIRKNVYPVDYDEGTRATEIYDTRLNKGEIVLLKIHGSLNWLYCPKCDELDITVGDKGITYIGKEHGVLCGNTNCTAKYEGLIIAPSMLKYYGNRITKKIFEMSEQCIAKAEDIIFIGYSLPLADTEVRCMILNGINAAKRKPRVTVVDAPRGNAKGNYLYLFGRINYRPIGFTKYLNEMVD